jgi:hypothetical protein
VSADLSTLARQLDQLLGAEGFSQYRSQQRVRADDQMVRERATRALSESVGVLTTLHAGFQRAYIPPATRQNPFPPADEMQRSTAILALRDRLVNTGAIIRGMPLPGVDRVWQQVRTGGDVLWQLLAFDYQLIATSEQVRERIAALTPSIWHDTDAPVELDHVLTDLERISRERQRVLAGI